MAHVVEAAVETATVFVVFEVVSDGVVVFLCIKALVVAILLVCMVVFRIEVSKVLE